MCNWVRAAEDVVKEHKKLKTINAQDGSELTPEEEQLLEEFERMLNEGGSQPMNTNEAYDELDSWGDGAYGGYNLDFSHEEMEDWFDLADTIAKQEEEKKKKVEAKAETKKPKSIVCECGGEKTQTPHFRWCPKSKDKR